MNGKLDKSVLLWYLRTVFYMVDFLDSSYAAMVAQNVRAAHIITWHTMIHTLSHATFIAQFSIPKGYLGYLCVSHYFTLDIDYMKVPIRYSSLWSVTYSFDC